MRATGHSRKLVMFFSLPSPIVTFIFSSASATWSPQTYSGSRDIGRSQYRHVRPTVKPVLTGNVTSFIQQAERSPWASPAPVALVHWFLLAFLRYEGCEERPRARFVPRVMQSYIPRSPPAKVIKTTRIKKLSWPIKFSRSSALFRRTETERIDTLSLVSLYYEYFTVFTI